MDEKEPVPIPSEVLVDRAMVGLVLVDQTTPLAVMVAPPSEVILPPEVAEVVVIAVMAVVVSVGMVTMSTRATTPPPTSVRGSEPPFVASKTQTLSFPYLR